jgi:tetratricopeptide (TPR) repeat protein
MTVASLDEPQTLESPAGHFVGRTTELERITGCLRAGGRVVVNGPPGVGKTAAAAEAFRLLADEFPDEQWVVNLRGSSGRPLTAVEAMAAVIRDFHPQSSKLAETEAGLLPIYTRVLEGKKAVVLLDDALNEAQVRPLLAAKSVAFVVTGASPLSLDGAESVPLGPVPPAEAVQLLRLAAGEGRADEDLGVVAEQCGFLPLTLRVAGEFLRTHGTWPTPHYINALRDEAVRLAKQRGATPEPAEVVATVSAIDFACTAPQRAERWQVLAIFPGDFDALGAAGVWGLQAAGGKPDEAAARDELTTLRGCGLVEYDEDTRRYSLHDLIRPAARSVFDLVPDHPSRAGTAGRLAAAEARFARHYCAAVQAAQQWLASGERAAAGLELFDREWVNIRRAQEWAAGRRMSDRTCAELVLGFGLGGLPVTNLRLTEDDRIEWVTAALDAAKFLKDQRAEGMALNALGAARRVQGDARGSVTYFEQALALARRLKDQLGTEAALANLGWAHTAMGDGRTAISYLDQGLAIARARRDRKAEGQFLGNMGAAHTALMEYAEALRFHALHLSICVETGDRWGEAAAVCNMGEAAARKGNWPAAVRAHEWHLSVSRDLRDRRGEQAALLNLGEAIAQAGQTARALEFQERGLAIARELGDRRAECRAHQFLGLTYRKAKEFAKAIEHHNRFRELSRMTGDRVSEGAAAYQLAVTLAQTGDISGAQKTAKEALAVLEMTKSPFADGVRTLIGELSVATQPAK